jgi:hypothetical protein
MAPELVYSPGQLASPPPRRRIRPAAIATAVVVVLLIVASLIAITGSKTKANPFETPPYAQLAVSTDQLPLASALMLGQTSGSVITPTQAQQVARSIWRTREDAMVHRKLGVIQEMEVGSPAAADSQYLGSLKYGTIQPVFTSPRPIAKVTVYVPRQTTWPAYFGASISVVPPTTAGAATAFIIVTRSGLDEPWKLAFSIGDANRADAISVPPPTLDADGYGVVTAAPMTPTAQWFSELTSYYRSWKDGGVAPDSSILASGPLTTVVGAQLAQHPQGYSGDGGRIFGHYQFQSPDSDQQWLLGLEGIPMVCGTVREMVANIPAQGTLVQTRDRYGWGPDVAPGTYPFITTDYDSPVCIYQQVAGYPGLAAFGTPGYQVASVGGS